MNQHQEHELTDEQIELAAKTGYERLDGYDWHNASEGTREDCRGWIRATAPLLQYPWQPPMPTEINELTDENMSNPPAGYRRAVAVALQEFVSRRNATLIPKPVDPRQAAIVKVVTSKYLYAAPEVLANAILEELDNWTVINHGR